MPSQNGWKAILYSDTGINRLALQLSSPTLGGHNIIYTMHSPSYLSLPAPVTKRRRKRVKGDGAPNLITTAVTGFWDSANTVTHAHWGQVPQTRDRWGRLYRKYPQGDEKQASCNHNLP